MLKMASGVLKSAIYNASVNCPKGQVWSKGIRYPFVIDVAFVRQGMQESDKG
jgi:hypothetical protein